MKKKTILIAGSSGLIGNALAHHFREYKLMKPGRSDFQLDDDRFAEKYDAADIILNFTGSPVIRRWTEKGKEEIYRSRIGTNRKLGMIIKKGSKKPRLFISASGIGIYSGSGKHTENSREFSGGFMQDLVSDWENEAFALQDEDTTVAVLRTGIVLDRKGQFIRRLLPVYRLGLGGTIGHGRQAFSWIHLKDYVQAVDFICRHHLGGVFNLVSPDPSTNRDFNRIFSKVLRRPAIFRVPRVMLYLLYGKAASVVTGGQSVLPERLEKEGFKFIFGELSQALRDIVD